MAKLYRWSKIGRKFLYKRHIKGHGIHSPFVFNLINNVIEEKRPYYFYEDVSKYLSQFTSQKLSINKSNLLSFRLVNYFDVKTVLEIGSSSGVNTLCLSAPSSKIKCIGIEKEEKNRKAAQLLYEGYGKDICLMEDLTALPQLAKFDCIYINFDCYKGLTTKDLKKISKHCHEQSFIIVKGIRSSRKHKRLWMALSEDSSRTALLDLFNIGIVFFDKKLSRWKYKISF